MKLAPFSTRNTRPKPSETNKANVPSFPTQTFALYRAQYLSQTAPHVDVRDIDIQYDVIMANPLIRRVLKNSPSEQLKKSFRLYADKWYSETARDSSISRMTSNVNYLKVIKLGPDVVPLILRELQSDPAPWFLALRVLTEDFEVGTGHAGNFEKIAEAWIIWGKERGLI